jgi:hypothetical protein
LVLIYAQRVEPKPPIPCLPEFIEMFCQFGLLGCAGPDFDIGSPLAKRRSSAAALRIYHRAKSAILQSAGSPLQPLGERA